jgi:hypothetical protein
LRFGNILAVLKGKTAPKVSPRSQKVKEMLADSKLSVKRRSELTREQYYLKYADLYELGLAGVPGDQKAKIILSLQYMVAATYRKTNYYHRRERYDADKQSGENQHKRQKVNENQRKQRQNVLNELSEATRERASICIQENAERF